MLGKPLVRDRDHLPVPALPVPGLVPGHQEDRLPPGIEREQQPDLRAADDGGRNSFMLWYLLPLTRSASGRRNAGPSSASRAIASSIRSAVSGSLLQTPRYHPSTSGCRRTSHGIPAIITNQSCPALQSCHRQPGARLTGSHDDNHAAKNVQITAEVGLKSQHANRRILIEGDPLPVSGVTRTGRRSGQRRRW